MKKVTHQNQFLETPKKGSESEPLNAKVLHRQRDGKRARLARGEEANLKGRPKKQTPRRNGRVVLIMNAPRARRKKTKRRTASTSKMVIRRVIEIATWEGNVFDIFFWTRGAHKSLKQCFRKRTFSIQILFLVRRNPRILD